MLHEKSIDGIKEGPHAVQENLTHLSIDRKTLTGWWVIGVLVSMICLVIGFVWQPDRYITVPSNSLNPIEAQIENRENKLLEKALNSGRAQYTPNMARIVSPYPLYRQVFMEMVRILISPTLPVILIGLLIQKTRRAY